ncbi:MAG: hypothetical protein DMF71_18080, partial [Acidobacteria bacterium]
MTAIYSARWILPIISAAIEDGAVAIEDSTIAGVGPRAEIISRFPGARISDFGEAAILPGLVNAHSHLELTVMRGFLEREESDFFAWLRKLTVARGAMTPAEVCASAMWGAVEAARAGITSFADSSSSAIEVIKAVRQIGLRATVYQESFGPDPKLAPENVARLRDQLGELRALETGLVRAGVSPHAPYTVSAPQMELISRLALDEKLPLMMHAAESDDEQSFLLDGSGVFAEGLRQRGIDWQAPGLSTIQYLKRHGILETQPLLAHCINVDDADLETIKESRAGIAHCPKSNAKLGHGRAPFAKYIANMVNVGLGSDSVASNNTCDLLEEARFATLLARALSEPPAVAGGPSSLSVGDPFRGGLLPANDRLFRGGTCPAITADQALFSATLGGARAMSVPPAAAGGFGALSVPPAVAGGFGALAEGLQADIIAVSLAGAHQHPVRNPADALVFSSSGHDVLLTMVAGKEIYREGRILTVD